MALERTSDSVSWTGNTSALAAIIPAAIHFAPRCSGPGTWAISAAPIADRMSAPAAAASDAGLKLNVYAQMQPRAAMIAVRDGRAERPVRPASVAAPYPIVAANAGAIASRYRA